MHPADNVQSGPPRRKPGPCAWRSLAPLWPTSRSVTWHRTVLARPYPVEGTPGAARLGAGWPTRGGWGRPVPVASAAGRKALEPAGSPDACIPLSTPRWYPGSRALQRCTLTSLCPGHPGLHKGVDIISSPRAAHPQAADGIQHTGPRQNRHEERVHRDLCRPQEHQCDRPVPPAHRHRRHQPPGLLLPSSVCSRQCPLGISAAQWRRAAQLRRMPYASALPLCGGGERGLSRWPSTKGYGGMFRNSVDVQRSLAISRPF